MFWFHGVFYRHADAMFCSAPHTCTKYASIVKHEKKKKEFNALDGT